MKPRSFIIARFSLPLAFALALSSSAHAQLYWDTDGATAGFGNASGTWGSDAFWNTDSSGGAGTFSAATATTDALNFGNGATGLGAGTITVSGTVDSGDMTFASGSGAITLSGGTINFAAAPTVTVNNTTNTITSALTGAGTSLTKAGTGTLVLSGGGTMAGNLIVAGGTVQLGADNGIATTAGIDIYGGTSASRVLNLNGYDQTLSKLVFTATDSAGNLTVTGGATSKLTINTATDTEIGAGGTLTSSNRPVTLDLSGLGEFEWSGSANIFRVGIRNGTNNASAPNPGTMTALLAGTNTITAATLGVATGAASNNGGEGILRLGQTNTLNANNINIGASGRSNATLNFRADLTGTPTVKIRGTDGTAPVTLWEIGRVAHNANSTWASTADFSAGEIDAKVSTLLMGSADAQTTGRAGTVNATFTMGKGTVEVGSLIIGQYTSAPTGASVANSGIFAGNGTFNLNDSTGIVKAGDIILADNIGAATGGTRTTSGTFNLLAGTLEAKTIGRGANTGSATATRAFNFTSGTIRNASGFDLSISNVPLNLTGSGTRIFEATAGQTITVASSSVISGSGQGFTKSGAGTLILGATNTYSGVTTVSAGTLRMDSSNRIPNSSIISIAGGATVAFNPGSSASFTLADGQDIEGTGSGTSMFNTGNATTNGVITTGNSLFSHTGSGTLEFQRLEIRGTGNEMTGGSIRSGVADTRRGLLVGNTTNGTFTISGGTFTSLGGAAQPDAIGTTNGSGIFNISGGNYANSGILSMGINNSNQPGGTLNINSGSATIGTLIYNSSSTGGQGIVNLNGGTLTVGTITSTAGQTREFNFNGGQFVAAGNVAFDSTLTLNVKDGGAKIDTVANNVSVSGNLVNSGTGGLIKDGLGRLTLSGTNTYTGATTINTGTLAVNGSITSNVTVNDGATLGGSGTITGTVTVESGGTHAVGNSPGLQTINGATTYNSGSIFAWDLAANLNGNSLTQTWDHDNNVNTAEIAARGSAYDAVNITGNLTVQSGAIFRVIQNEGVDFSNAFWTQNQQWSNIFNVTGGNVVGWAADTAVAVYNLANTNITSSIAPYGSFTISGTTLSWQAIPEPTTALAGLLLTAGLLRRRRKNVG